MESSDTRRANGRQSHLGADELNRAIGEFRMPLTVMYGYTQLLHRRIRQGRILEAYACLDGLASIERAAQVMEEQLRMLDEMMHARKHVRDKS